MTIISIHIEQFLKKKIVVVILGPFLPFLDFLEGSGVFPHGLLMFSDSIISVLYSKHIQPEACVNKETTLIFHHSKTLENI